MKKRRYLPLVIIVLLLWGMRMAYSPDPLAANIKIDRLVVEKSEHRLLAYAQGRLVKTYIISLGKQPVGDKQFEGDNKTPEGLYVINDKNPHSKYYKNLGVSYPNKADRQQAARLGKPVGGAIKIHGLPPKVRFLGKLHRFYDWTAGCMAVTNDEMEELYRAVPLGTPILIKP